MSKTKPYVLAVVSHKGGTARTTTALALACLWGERGLKVGLVDADPSGSVRLVAADSRGRCPWPNVQLLDGVRQAAQDATRDVVVIDGPCLGGREAADLAAHVDGLILTCLADVLSFRTLPVAAQRLDRLGGPGKSPRLLGVLLTRFRAGPLQGRIKGEIERLQGDLLLRPDVPEDNGLRAWGLAPGSPPPAGGGRQAYARLAEELASRVGLSVPPAGRPPAPHDPSRDLQTLR